MEARKQLPGGPIRPSPFSQQGVGARTWKREKPELCTQNYQQQTRNMFTHSKHQMTHTVNKITQVKQVIFMQNNSKDMKARHCPSTQNS